MTTMERVTLSCPNCGADVEASVLTSTNFVGTTTDLQRITSGFSPLEFLIHSCQRCGFTGSRSDFSGEVPDQVAARVERLIHPHLRDEQVRTDVRWEFAAMIAEWRGLDPRHIAQLYHNAARCAIDGERRRYYQRKAADWYEETLQGEPEDGPTLVYLIGELYRRVGDTQIAAAWFDRAIAAAGEVPDGESLATLARQQKSDPREEL